MGCKVWGRRATQYHLLAVSRYVMENEMEATLWGVWLGNGKWKPR